jgi:hypothetical protein
MDAINGRYLIIATWTKMITAGPLTGIAPTGKPPKFKNADFLDIKDGKIAAWTQYYDKMSLLAQMGLISPKQSSSIFLLGWEKHRRDAYLLRWMRKVTFAILRRDFLEGLVVYGAVSLYRNVFTLGLAIHQRLFLIDG